MDFDQPNRHVNLDGPPPMLVEALTAGRLRRWLVKRDG
jgi:hypothetical protein